MKSKSNAIEVIINGELELSGNDSRKDSESKVTFEGPNEVKYEHFLRALELAEKCEPEPDKRGGPFPRVGVVVVKKGRIISEAYRGESGAGEHAEYIALEKKAGGNSEIQGADLITTLEPCITRSHDKRPCVSWVKSRKIRKVWIATLDYNPNIAGIGELELEKAGILIGRFPDDLVPLVLQDNKEFFDMIQLRQPKMKTEEQKIERSIIIETLKESLKTNHQKLEFVFNNMLHTRRSEKENREWQRSINELNAIRNNLAHALNFALAVEMNVVGSWVHLGDSLKIADMYGSAILAYRVATEIDAMNKWAWKGLVITESQLSKDDSYWPRYYTVKESDSSPLLIRSSTWLEHARSEGNRSMAIRLATRAIQNGGNIDLVWQSIEDAGQASIQFHQEAELKFPKMGGRDKKQYKEDQEREVEAWFILGEVLESIGEKEKKRKCDDIKNVVLG